MRGAEPRQTSLRTKLVLCCAGDGEAAGDLTGGGGSKHVRQHQALGQRKTEGVLI